MFIPNRVGEHVLAEIAADNLINPITAANFGLTVGTTLVHQVQTRTANLNDPVHSDAMRSTEDWTINGGESFAYGVFIDGSHSFEGAEQLYLASAAASFQFATEPGSVSVTLQLGRLDAGSVTVNHAAQVNAVSHSIILPAKIHKSNQAVHASFQGAIVDGKFNTLQDFTAQPLGLYWCIHNELGGGGSEVVNSCHMAMSLYSYKEIVTTFDPLRG